MSQPSQTSSSRTSYPPIAIVGVGALTPGATEAGAFWRNVVTGRDLITDVPSTHWLIEDYYDPDPAAPDKTYGRRGGFLPPVDFDPLAFGMPPNNLQATDTTQLLSLLVAEQVFGDAVGKDLDALDRERVSVILGTAALELLTAMSNRLQRPVWQRSLRAEGLPEEQVQQICDRIADHYVPWQEASFPGLLSNVVAGRIANRFNLHGTNNTTDAACAGSFAALASAAAELAMNTADLVITGGVDTLNDITMYMCFSKTPALSGSGDCRPFSDSADGTMLGEALVMFALKRLADAERDGDHIYAVVRGVGSSSDGKGSAIYAPVPAGQARALRRAYEVAGYGPESVELVEAHGTGTVAGDAAEFTALRTVFEESGRAGRQWCALGSAKSQLGHTKSAAGAVGLLKAVLALGHRTLPPTIKVERPNPELDLADSPLYLNTEARPWVRGSDHPRRAAVSSFGFGGSNFHLTIEEYTPRGGHGDQGGTVPALYRTAPTELVTLSAPSSADLVSRAREACEASGSLTAMARASQRDFRPGHHARLAVVAADLDEARSRLLSAARLIEQSPEKPFTLPDGTAYAAGPADPGRVAFLFPGQGSQYPGMGAGLAMYQPRALAVWDRTADLALGEQPLHRMVFPVPAFTDAERQEQEEGLTATEVAQPALAAASLAQLAVLRALGVAPHALAGHSFGELVAMHAAGAIGADDLMYLARRRGELMRDCAAHSPGAMLAVSADRERVEGLIAGYRDHLWIANHNAPTQVVVSGEQSAIEALEGELSREGISARRLKTSSAFHSPLVARAVDGLAEFLTGIAITAPRIPVYSNADAGIYSPYADPDVLRRQLAQHSALPVHFVDQIEAMYRDGVRTFIEVGAGHVLSGLVKNILGTREYTAVSLDRRGRDGATALHQALAALAVAGIELNFDALWDGYRDEVEAQHRTPSRLAVKISGANFGRPYPVVEGATTPAEPPAQAPKAPQTPKPAPDPVVPHNDAPAPAETPPAAPIQFPQTEEPPIAVFAATVPPPFQEEAEVTSQEISGTSASWLSTFEEAQRQTAEVQADFHRSMAEAHTAYLMFAQSSAASLAAAIGGAVAIPASPIGLPAVYQPVIELPAADNSAVGRSGVYAPAVDQRAFAFQAFDQDAVHLMPSAPVTPAAVPVLPTAPIIEAEPSPRDAAPAMSYVPAASAPAVPDAADVHQLLLEVIAEKTGYPLEVLSTDLALETDLGIDSIKRVEILAALRTQVPDLAEMPVGELSKLRTLGEIQTSIIEALGGQSGGAVAGQPVPARALEPEVSEPDVPLTRKVVTAVARRAAGLELPGLRLGAVAVTEDGRGVAGELVSLLRDHGIDARTVDEVPGDASAVIFLGGLRPVRSAHEGVAVNREAFRVAKAVAVRLSTGTGAFVTVQDTGGDFGLGGGQGDRAWLGGLAALVRTAGREWPGATVKAIDCATDGFADPRRIAEAIATELLKGGSVPEAGLHGDGIRLVLRDEELPVTAADARRPVTDRSVVIASGGGRGVTGAALRALAAAHQPRIALLGRTELIDEPAGLQDARDEFALRRALAQRAAQTGLPTPPPARLASEAKQIMAVREIREALTALEAAGSPVRYIAADVRDAQAVAAALDEVRAVWGPITGVVHGAGVIADRTIADKTPEQFADVFDTKVAGLQALLAATAGDPLSFVGLFSSVSARYGNVGQSDYAMANEVLDQVACTVRRNRPDCLVRSIAWGPWQGGMVGASLEEHFRRSGVALIPLGGGARAFVNELATPGDDVRIVVSAGADVTADAEPHAWTAAPELRGELRAGLNIQPFLSDHVIAGTPVVPVALVLEWFWGAAAAHHASETRTALRDVQVLSKIALAPEHAGPSTLQLVSRPHDNEDGGVHLQLVGGTGPHYRAKAAHHAHTAPAAWNRTELFNGSASAAAERAAARGLIYDGDVLFHGPRFHVLGNIAKISAEGAEATVRGARHLGWDRERWNTDPAAVDGVFQLALLWAEHVMGAATLPMGVDQFHWHASGPLNEAARCVVRAGRVDEHEAICDAQLTGRDGSVIGELHGIRLLRRP